MTDRDAEFGCPTWEQYARLAQRAGMLEGALIALQWSSEFGTDDRIACVLEKMMR